ncbi:MAG: SOS response-associated peptidase family protein [Hydrogenophaga sp.]|uniref:SOS response-associated peptidase n=1 Tax=Hydrogenophaga sp. TaxID=1904254 RepID=UPI001E0409E2|nr:SOS response-associated peptidase family protein [Hydrogenophaga sp.]MBX3611924.1 SOS response-associated peptidase family protein [Hydrogenophaga sp.]
MCTNYTPATPKHLVEMKALGLAAAPPDAWPSEVYPGMSAPVVVASPDGAPRAEVARFGLIPRWVKDGQQAQKVSRGTLNARSETVASKPSFRAPWRERRFALAPMLDFFEPCWEDAHLVGHRSVRWRIARADAAPFCVAALHERWTDPATGEIVPSFSLLTINADGHELLGRMHRPGDEKRMLVVLPSEHWADWLRADHTQALAMLQRTPPGLLVGEPAPRETPSRPAPTPPPAEPPDPQRGLF